RRDRGDDLARTGVRGHERTLAFGDMPADVLEHDYGVVDDAPDGDHHPAQREDVESDPLPPQSDQGDEQREGNRDGRDDRRPRAAQKDKDDDYSEESAEQTLFEDVADGLRDRRGLVLDRSEVHAVADGFLDPGYGRPYLVGHRHCVGVRAFDDAQADAELAV